MIRKDSKPELLCPAGSPLAFDAAIEAGADAIYVGGSAFNARQHAQNFTEAELKEAIARAHAYGVRVYVAMNTLVSDKEADTFLCAARSAYLCGADALIVADLGAANLLHRALPDLPLHASTQLSGHNAEAAEVLSRLGFVRMVCAREMSEDDLRSFVAHAPLEAEVFVHGALCVCHSGQCLFSSVVGGRSGNRGECAQPCRLPYRTQGGEGYPLSLKDLSLAAHVKELCDMGVASFKIEGRMKSPEYVRDVTRVFRTLIDEHRNATPEEMAYLSRIFSRSGLTDGYYRKRIDHHMLGTRSEGDKQSSRTLTPFEGLTKKIPLHLSLLFKKDKPMALTVQPHGITVYGDVPQAAQTAPLTREMLSRNLSKLGNTPYAAERIDVDMDEGLMLPLSAVNALRRRAVEALQVPRERKMPTAHMALAVPQKRRTPARSALCYRPEQISDELLSFFDTVYLPLDRYDGSVSGVALPPVILPHETEEIDRLLAHAVSRGATDALVGNLGHMVLAQAHGLTLHGDLRLNVTNNGSMHVCESLGFSDVILSPELSVPQMRDIGGRSYAVVYGRLPLMVTEKCVSREISDCRTCESDRVILTDRRGVHFPVLREWQHRSLIVNSVVLYMADRLSLLDSCGVTAHHYIFTDETPDEVRGVIDAYQHRLPPAGSVKRIAAR